MIAVGLKSFTLNKTVWNALGMTEKFPSLLY